MSMTVDPSLVIGGGGVSRAGDNIIKPVRRSAGPPVRRHLADLCLFPTELRASSPGGESVALGAAVAHRCSERAHG
ncbi:hypothetical protein OHA44_08520 [Streptomyces sp. NBC_00144]|uniref:hypothetical protein n=1 Tax=Streptomyces sp. NBC_00144 TaxID=2975665 RepID=UPI003246495E